MTWLDSLDVSIAEALECYPDAVSVASVTTPHETFLVSRDSLADMHHMQLGHLPLSAITLPYHQSEILTRSHEEKLVRNFSHHLTDYFPNYFVAAIYELQSLFAQTGFKAYIIGGITRDLLLSSERRFEVQDVDIIIEGKALDAARSVCARSRNFSLEQTFTPFGTLKLDYRKQIALDFASTRKEVYSHCGALPEIVELGVPLEVDIIRRDFTINALGLSIVHPGQVIDYTGGLQDLEAKVIRIIKPPSFFEDPTRIIRAHRFAMRLDFAWSDDTLLLLDQFLTWMPEVYKGGGDRIHEELTRFFSHPETAFKLQALEFFLSKGLHRLIDTSLPTKIELPVPLGKISERIEILQHALGDLWRESLSWEIYISFIFMSIPAAQVQTAMHRLNLSRPEIETVERSIRLLHENIICPLSASQNPMMLYDVFHGKPLGTVCVGLILSPQFTDPLEAFLTYKRTLEPIKLEVSGDDIIKLGVPQGEQVGRLLKALHYAKLQGKVAHRLDELAWLKNQLEKDQQSTPEESVGTENPIP